MASKNASIKYFAYVRKSIEGEEKQALSIDSQKEKIVEFFPHLHIIATFEERRSSFVPHKREVFAKMIERIRKGEAQGIVAWHPDRLSRNEIDAATITYMIRTGEIEDLKFGSYHFDNSPEGIMMLQLALSQSQYSSAKLSKDVKRGMEKKAQMGWMPGVAPMGYLNTPKRQLGHKIVVKDPERFRMIREMWDLMLTGNYTPPQILKIANEQLGYRTVKRQRSGGRPLSRTGIYKIFITPFYYGWFEYPVGSGKWHKGKHEPMVTQEEFERVQILLGRKGRPRVAAHRKTFSFTGLIRCGECGCQITAEQKHHIICTTCKHKFSSLTQDICPKCQTATGDMKNPTTREYVYYHCTKKKPGVRCTQGGIEVAKLEAQIDEYLASIQINEKYLDWAIKHLNKAHKVESASQKATLKSQQKAYQQIASKLNKLMEMRITDEISPKEYAAKKAEYEKKREGLKERLTDVEHRQDRWLETAERFFNFAAHARDWFMEGDMQQKREILSTIGSNLTLMDKKLSIDAPKPFFLLQKNLRAIPEAKPGFEPTKNRSNKGKREPCSALNPHWLSHVDGIRTFFEKESSNFLIATEISAH